jgi:hypothetical protein
VAFFIHTKSFVQVLRFMLIDQVLYTIEIIGTRKHDAFINAICAGKMQSITSTW